MRPVPAIVLLMVLSCPVGAGDDSSTPLIFFRKPDRATEKLIRDDLIRGGVGIGAGTRDQRAAARRDLIVIDAWAVPYLAEALYGRNQQGDAMVRMNAAATLARILDPRALPEIRGAAVEDKDRWVRRFSVLALGLYRRADDIDVFLGILKDRDKRLRDPAAALALGKLPYSTATNALLSRLGKPPRDQHLAAALLLAASIRSPETPAGDELFLKHKEKVIRRVAAACLLIRPPTPAQTAELLKAVEDTGDREVRELQYYALGLIPERTDAIRAALLDCGVKTKFKPDVRIAALIGLADEWNVRANFGPLHDRYRAMKGRNDPVVAALLHAMVRSGDPQAVEICQKVVKTGSSFLRFYASAALFHRIALAGQEPPPDADQIAGDIVAQRTHTQDADLLRLIDLVSRWRSPPEGVVDRRKLARDGFKEIGDPKELHLFDWDRKERAWALLNRMIPYVLELDEQLVDLGTHDTSKTPAPDPGAGKAKSESGSEEELDLLDFLKEKPYFDPGDLGGATPEVPAAPDGEDAGK